VAVHQDTKYRKVPPHVLRQWRADGFVLRRCALFAHRPVVRATTNSVHPRLRARERQVGVLLGLDDPTELGIVLEDIGTLLARCVLHLKNQLATRREVRSWQARKLRATRGSATRGRPPGAADFAARQLGLGLGMLWYEHTGRRPTRTYSDFLGLEKGDYRAFVKLIVDSLPLRVVRKKNGRLRDIDYIVRQSTADFDKALRSREEYQRRGLIDEIPWLKAGTRSAPAAAAPSN